MSAKTLRRERERRVLRLPEVEQRTGLGRSWIYDAVARGRFPRPIAIGKRAAGWLEHEVDAWLDERIAERDAGTAERNLPLAGLNARRRNEKAGRPPRRRRPARDRREPELEREAAR